MTVADLIRAWQREPTPVNLDRLIGVLAVTGPVTHGTRVLLASAGAQPEKIGQVPVSRACGTHAFLDSYSPGFDRDAWLRFRDAKNASDIPVTDPA